MLHSLDVGVNALGVTVRRGLKWAGAEGEQIKLCVCTGVMKSAHVIQGVGLVREVWIGMFINVPGRLLELEHEHAARHYSGLRSSMERAYQGFDAREEVTVLMYERQS